MNEIKKIVCCTKKGESHIDGYFYMPMDGRDKHPTVIMCHGLGGTHMYNEYFAIHLAKAGYATYQFDFCRGGTGSLSDGQFLEMSILTEVEDLHCVLQMVRKQSFVDPTSVYLLGESQGGYVAALEASTMPTFIKGIILLYPAFSLLEEVKKLFPEPNDIPETFDLFEFAVGRKYGMDLFTIDIMQEIGKYPGRVLLLHGSKDDIVPVSISQRVVNIYEHAELSILYGAGHGFYDEEEVEANTRILSFLRDCERNCMD